MSIFMTKMSYISTCYDNRFITLLNVSCNDQNNVVSDTEDPTRSFAIKTRPRDMIGICFEMFFVSLEYF